jgi:sugar/nucleoside kinase (ribokinase family)
MTSFGPDVPAGAIPADLAVLNVATSRTSIFVHEERPEGRRMRLLSRAADLEESRLPDGWRGAALVLLCPVATEVDPGLAAAFAEASLGVAPQGWMRRRGADGVIGPQWWEDAELVLPYAQLLVVSAEDIRPFEAAALEWVQQVPVAVVTRGRQGALLYVNGERYHVEPDSAVEVDATGAGDVFAATMLIEYHRDGNAWDAAVAAACCAAASVEAAGADAIPDRPALEARVRAYRARQSR